MILIRFKYKGDAVMGILFDQNGNLGTYFTIEKLSKHIPMGHYKVELTKSPKFKKDLPIVYNDSVTKRRGIRIHEGNSVKDTEGCILIGNTANLNSITIGDSKKAVSQIVKELRKRQKEGLETPLFVIDEI